MRPCSHQAIKQVIVKTLIIVIEAIKILTGFNWIGKAIAAVERIAIVKTGKNNQTNNTDRAMALSTIGI